VIGLIHACPERILPAQVLQLRPAGKLGGRSGPLFGGIEHRTVVGTS